MSVKRSDFTVGMLKDLYKYFFETYDETPTVYDQVFDVQPSDAAYEQSTSVVGMGQLAEKPESDAIAYRKPLEGFTTYGINKTWSDGVEISMEAVEDHQKIGDLLRATARTWGSSVKATRETFYAKTFNYGGYTAGHDHFKNVISGVISQNTGGLVYDGKPLFTLTGNARSSKNGGTYYNSLGALSLTQANLITAYNLMTSTNNRNERDEIVQIIPDTLLVPPALRFTGSVILNSTLLPGSGNNDVNAMAGIVRLVVWPYLTDTDAWFLLKAKSGLVAQNRKDPVIDFYQDEDTKSFKANIVARFGHRVDNFRFVVGANLSTS